MTFEELVKLRYEKISRSSLSKILHYSKSIIRNYERGAVKVSSAFLERYEQVLLDCITGKIQYDEKHKFNYVKDIKKARELRQKLGLTLREVSEVVFNKKASYLGKRELGYTKTTQEDYSRLMDYYKEKERCIY